MAPSLSMTHIGTATAILHLNGVNFITDPFFSPAGSSMAITSKLSLTVSDDPGLRLDQLPIIDAVLLSHEDHWDNLDDLGRRLLDGRRVFTTVDGANNLAPRPSVHGMKPWEEIQSTIAGQKFRIIATPTQHARGQECTGFIVTSETMGQHKDGLPNAIYFSGDTVYLKELKQIGDRFHICAAILNLGNAHVPENYEEPESGGAYQVTMDGKQAALLSRDIKADVIVPMHYESWGHFTQFGDELRQAFEAEGVSDKVCWLKLGKEVQVL
ncbi:uncharacterized protein N0V89_000175 [Didymosphaeria variabile]|uniref:Metallo-beta-lactamase domain-containing protein n=1 Tax=Didymosphaeria variabile TaxID=1932322 RepID=A0A9W8XVM7_9PLEO|nr:uncharacterized protein N0V89_000175 [Didymosphaeria variabile]KAJ4359620.1 hypothetical protein N0V89_000175 [Didymosphaeria variabile]